MVWEAQRLPAAHVALDTRIPSITHTEKAEVVKRAWESLEARGLARNGRVVPELADGFALLANAPGVDRPVDLGRPADQRAGRGHR